MYQGESLEGECLVVVCEQGNGDILQFARYLALLKSEKKVKRLLVLGPKCFESLIEHLSCVDLYTVNTGKRLVIPDEFNFWVLLMSLPEYFDTQLDTIPTERPYLFVNKEMLKEVEKLPTDSFKIGVVWKGNCGEGANEKRSLSSLQQLKPLWDLAKNNNLNISFVSLQKEDLNDELGCNKQSQPMVDVAETLIDYNHTAAIVEQLDLVISIDTSIVHLAGALNIPCWVLLPYFKRCWRWSDAEESSAWYPGNMRLFGQRSDEKTWKPAIERLTDALKIKVQQTRVD